MPLCFPNDTILNSTLQACTGSAMIEIYMKCSFVYHHLCGKIYRQKIILVSITWEIFYTSVASRCEVCDLRKYNDDLI